MVTVSMTFSTLIPVFKVMAFLKSNISKVAYYGRSYYSTLTENHT